ncbi:hypothetical protein ACVSDK_004709 [Escherichia coli]
MTYKHSHYKWEQLIPIKGNAFHLPPWVQLIRVNLRTAPGVIFAHYASFSEKNKTSQAKIQYGLQTAKKNTANTTQEQKLKNTKFLDKNNEITQKKTIKKQSKHKDTYLFAICKK